MKKSNLFEELAAEYQAEAARAIEEHLNAVDLEREKKALDNAWNEAENKVKNLNKASRGRTINGATPKRKSAKFARWETYRFANKSLPLNIAIGKLFTETDYASGAAASVIRAMGFNLLGSAEKARQAFNAQNNYNRGKSMLRWAREELKCIGIINRDDLVSIMVRGLTE